MLVTVIVLAIIGILLIFFEEDLETKYMSYSGIIFLFIGSFLLGVLITLNHEHKTKQTIKPKVEIHCVDGKCDTTFIYYFKCNK